MTMNTNTTTTTTTAATACQHVWAQWVAIDDSPRGLIMEVCEDCSASATHEADCPSMGHPYAAQDCDCGAEWTS